MKGLWGRAGFETSLRELPDRPLGPDEVRVKVLACGVCGTDLHFLRQAEEPSPLGHEVCGQVLAVGGSVTRFSPGQQVVMEDASLCGVCDQCKSARVDLCRSGPTMQGQPGMAEEIVLHHSMLHLAEGLDPVAASMTEPLAVAIRCVETLAPDPMKPLLIFGMGAIGLFCAAYARFRGAGPITLVARNPESQRNRAAERAALALGAERVLYMRDKDWQNKVQEAGPFPAIIVAAPPTLAKDAMKLLDYGGTALACGVTFGRDTSAEIDINDMVFNKKNLLTSIAEPGLYFPLALSLIRSGKIDVGKIITHQLPLSQAEQLKTLYNQDAPAIKTVIIPG